VGCQAVCDRHLSSRQYFPPKHGRKSFTKIMKNKQNTAPENRFRAPTRKREAEATGMSVCLFNGAVWRKSEILSFLFLLRYKPRVEHKPCHSVDV
jgi:hypothetical protein